MAPITRCTSLMGLGYDVAALGSARFQVTVGFQPRTTSKVEIRGVDSGSRFQFQHTSLGAMFNFDAFIAVRAGLEYRMEKLNGSGSGLHDVSNNRPWLKVDLGHTFRTQATRPFVGLELAAALRRKGLLLGGAEADLLRAYAPDYQIGIYGGVHFKLPFFPRG
jgi:hypothetical protein